ncbi:MAG: ankyrin repeat domain-containing protein [Sulfobacillus sp.]
MDREQWKQLSENKKHQGLLPAFQIGTFSLLLVLMTALAAWAGSNEDLEHAIYQGDLAAVRQALAHGADPNHFSGNLPLLQEAVIRDLEYENGQLPDWHPINDPMEVVKFLLDHGANPNLRKRGRYHYTNTALGLAGRWQHGNIPMVKLLLAQGAVPTQADIDYAYGICKTLMERAVLGP